MEQGKGTTALRKGKHLNHTERILIEKLLTAGLSTLMAYNADRAQDVHDLNATAKGMPDALCAKSIYNYIDQGWIPGVANETVWEKRKRRRNARKTVSRLPRKAPQRRKRIDERPGEVDSRSIFGHWEIDLVVGGSCRAPVLRFFSESCVFSCFKNPLGRCSDENC